MSDSQPRSRGCYCFFYWKHYGPNGRYLTASCNVKKRFSWGELSQAKLSQAKLRQAEPTWPKLSQAKLSFAELSWIVLCWAGVEQNWAELSWAELRWILLSWAGLSRTELSWSEFSLNWPDLSQNRTKPDYQILLLVISQLYVPFHPVLTCPM